MLGHSKRQALTEVRGFLESQITNNDEREDLVVADDGRGVIETTWRSMRKRVETRGGRSNWLTGQRQRDLMFIPY